MEGQVIVVLSADVEPDPPELGSSRFNVYNLKFTWRGVEEGIKAISERIRAFRDSWGKEACMTWFVRSDIQIKVSMGDTAYMFRRYRDLWADKGDEGDEIGWHPHLWRWSKDYRCWLQEIENRKWISDCLSGGYNGIIDAGFHVKSVRMGWNFHNNVTMNKIDELGIMVDCSAVPGLFRSNNPRIRNLLRGSNFNNHCDWTRTPSTPYHPSKNDYQRPCSNQGEYLSVLEIPNSTLKTYRRLFPYPRQEMQWSIVKSHAQMKGVVRKVFNKVKSSLTPALLVGAIHPEDALSHPSRRLYGICIDNVSKNLKVILDESARTGVSYGFTTPHGVLDLEKTHDF